MPSVDMTTDADLQKALATAGADASVIANADRSVVLTRAFFPAMQDVTEGGTYFKLAMCMSGGGTLRYRSSSRALEFRWRKGGMFCTFPHERAEFVSPDVDIIGLAIDPEVFSSRLTSERLQDALAGHSDDSVIQSVLTALWTTAEFHGGPSAFIDAGVNLILERLTSPDATLPAEQNRTSLSRRQLSKVQDYLESRLPADLRVRELADLIGMEEGRFCRALKATTGYAPYAFLTARRMERAKSLLAAGISVTDTAISVGYANPSKFAAAFKKFVGCPPSAWRRRCGGS